MPETKSPVRILFVCHGNICRSPMAEYILKDLVRKKGIADRFVIASAATSAEEIRGGVGRPIYPPAKAELTAHGVPFENRQAVQLVKADYARYDLFIGMDRWNLSDMLRLFGGDPEHKLHLLMEYTPRGGDVADPWYSDRFDVAYRDIAEGCAGLLKTF